jgi:AGCS family alanine or glycine:cation symporter
MFLAQLSLLETIDNLLWAYAAVPALLCLGIFLTFKSRFVQLRRFPRIFSTFIETLGAKHDGTGVHPLKVFFTCIGGCMGIGNVVAVCTAAQIGGPGSLFWVWITAIAGMILKYSEVYLGVRHRLSDGRGGFRGGPMYYLRRAYKTSFIPKIVCLLLCVYGVEIYQFSVVTDSLSTNLNVDAYGKYTIALVMISLMIAISRRGVDSVGRIALVCIPCFIVCYLGMAGWVLYQNFSAIPAVVQTIVQSAFTGHAATGAFVGSGILLTASQGIRRSCYAGDVAVGYASVIHSETGEVRPEKQASLAIVEIFLDSFVICTTSVLLVLITGVWDTPVEASMLVQNALAQYFPAMHIFMPVFLLLLGFTTIVAYFCAGIKCAEHLCPKIGRKSYYVYASCSLLFFSSMQPSQALTVMSIAAGVLLLFNLHGIYRLRHEIDFMLPEKSEPQIRVQLKV